MAKFAVVYNNLYADTVTQNFKSFLDNELYIDLVFVCRNNKKVGAHQIVMGCISKLFYSMFIENLNTAREKVIHVYVPDIRAKIMKLILQFIYSGKAMLNKEELTEFNEDIKLLGMPLDLFTPIDETAVGCKKTSISDSVISNSSTRLTSSTSTEPIMPSVTSSLNAAVATGSSTIRFNEAVVSSSISSIVSSAPLPLPPLLENAYSPSGISNANTTPGLPVITSVHALKPDANHNFFERTSCDDLATSTNITSSSGTSARTETATPPINPSTVPVLPVAIPTLQNENNLPKPNTNGRKRTRNTAATNAGQCINLDSDDENDIIMIS